MFSLSFPRLCLAVFFLLLSVLPARAETDDFASWLADVRREALQKGISPATLDSAFADLQPIDKVIELDRKQPEFTQTFWRYLDLRVTDTRISRGKLLLAEHEDLLAAVSKEYGVPARFLVAFWGLETNFGDNTGGFPVIGALATLAHDPRRSHFFRKELLAALTILDQGHIGLGAMRGSWAGAMGQPQFMPSTFARYAVDEDGDGRKDIWRSLPDVFASAANFLARLGWKSRESWGMEVRLPAGFNLDLVGLETKKKTAEWEALGVKTMAEESLETGDALWSLILPAGYRGPCFLVGDNFSVILNWNRSNLYAVAVGHLADRLIGGGPLQSPRPELEEPLSIVQFRQLQSLLQMEGFDPGVADGIIGSGASKAIKAYQRSTNQPADGYPTTELLQQLIQAGSKAAQEEGKKTAPSSN